MWSLVDGGKDRECGPGCPVPWAAGAGDAPNPGRYGEAIAPKIAFICLIFVAEFYGLW
jgi:hypothetical protein